MTGSRQIPRRGEILRAAAGLLVYAVAFGVSFGAVAVTAGLSVPQTMLLSLVMFTGASQFAFVGVAAAGAPIAAVSAALLLGARNSFYGVSIAHLLRPRSWRRLTAAHFVIDETTALTVSQADRASQRFAFFASGLAMWVGWNAGSATGALLGSVIDTHAFGLDAAAPAVFLALLWPALRGRRARVVALGAAALALVLIPLTAPGVPVLAAALVAVVAGIGGASGTSRGSGRPGAGQPGSGQPGPGPTAQVPGGEPA